MINQYPAVLSPDDIEYIHGLPEVLDAKARLDATSDAPYNTIYFSSKLSPRIKAAIYIAIPELDTSREEIPMRWIKGDLESHLDTGHGIFDNTYLIYLSDSPGSLVIEDHSFPITQGTGYKFNEGLRHETTGTSGARLMIGPMSESGFPVGISDVIEGDGGTTAYIRQSGSDIEYSYDNLNWITIVYWYCYLKNTDTSKGMFKVIFTTDITINESYKYFMCQTSHIQIGSASLKAGGLRPVITISGVTNYQGFIGNRLSGVSFPNISIFNLSIHSVGSTLTTDGGWLGQSFFATEVNNNYIVNCSSDGDIGDSCGGIVGSYAGYGSGSSLTLIGCSSSGSILNGADGNLAGGILGNFAGAEGGLVTCISCWSTGIIDGTGSGGIAGGNAGGGETDGNVVINDCYSEGTINGYQSGGIIGDFALKAEVNNCYSRGNITGNESGGILGSNSANIPIINCYSTGTINSSGDAGGIVGANPGTVNVSRCYTSGTINLPGKGYIVGGSDIVPSTNYAESDHGLGAWNDNNATSTLQNVPTTIPGIGPTWISNSESQPFKLKAMGYTPYSLNNISTSGTPSLNRTYSASVNSGSATSAGIRSGLGYTIITKSGGGSTITINSTSGAISTTSETAVDTYTIWIYNTGSYNVSQYTLTVTSVLPCLTAGTTVLTPAGYVPVDTLRNGDKVVTSDGRRVPIVNIFTSSHTWCPRTCPRLIRKDSIAPGYPSQDFSISPKHLIKYPSRQFELWLEPGAIFPRDKSQTEILYFHLKLPNYITDHLVINDGIVVESLSLDLSADKQAIYTKEYHRRVATFGKPNKFGNTIKYRIKRVGHANALN